MYDTLYLIDGSFFLFRAYFAIKFKKTNALYGFVRSINKLLSERSPKYIAIVFDGANHRSKRQAIYPQYKSNRNKMPEDLVDQFVMAEEYCTLKGLPYLKEHGVEADDLIGSIAKWGELHYNKIIICSGDKDLYQLISNKTSILQTHKGYTTIDKDTLHATMGIYPEQVIDYLSITGDSSDNIPGVPKIGAKRARSVLEEYESLKNLFTDPNCPNLTAHAKQICNYMDLVLTNQKIISLQTNIPHHCEVEWYGIKAEKDNGLKNFYKRFQFRSFIHSDTATDSQIYPTVDIDKLLTQTDRVYIHKSNNGPFLICTETSPTWHVQNDTYTIKNLFAAITAKKICVCAYDIKTILKDLYGIDVAINFNIWDPMVAAYILSPGENSLRFHHLLETIGSGVQQSDPKGVVELVKHYERLLEQDVRLHGLFINLEMALIPVLVRMEIAGIPIDGAYLQSLSIELCEKRAVAERDIFKMAGKEFNIRSPKQLKSVLHTICGGKSFAKTTNHLVLKKRRSKIPIIDKVIEFRTLDKLISTYTTKLSKCIDHNTRRIHCKFLQTSTATGRLSCRDPNLQNIPLKSHDGARIREAFAPKNGTFASLDYSQIELRILAHFSGDKTMVQAFNDGEDLHTTTAALLFHVDIGNVSTTQRVVAKTMNFAIVYGQGAYGLSQQLNIPMKDAEALIQQYFDKYKGLSDYISQSKEEARATGRVYTLMGRYREIQNINSTNKLLRMEAERLAINSIMQGSQADIIKKAMIKIDEYIIESEADCKMVLQIHDELLIECNGTKATLLEEMKSKMENVVTLLVPIKVNISVGENWGKCYNHSRRW